MESAITWPAKETIPHDDDHLILLVVPTVAAPEVLIPTIAHLSERLSYSTRVVLAINSDRPDLAKEAFAVIQQIPMPAGCTLEATWADGPIGFGNAINQGVMHAINNGGLPAYTIIFNDDLRVTHGWIEGLIASMEADYIQQPDEPPINELGQRPSRSREDWGRVGVVGPVTDCSAGLQCVISDPERRAAMARNPDLYEKFAAHWKQNTEGQISAVNFLSGFCMMFNRDCVIDLMVPTLDDESIWAGPFDGPTYPIAGYEDNDLCYRAQQKGWKLAVAYDTFIGHLGHQTFDRAFSEMDRGLRNQLAYYRRWQDVTQAADQKVVASIRTRIATVNDIHMLRGCVLRHSELLDGMAFLLTNNPLEIQDAHDWNDLQGSLSEQDQAFLKACSQASPDDIAGALKVWVEHHIAEHPKSRECPVDVGVWTLAFNERDERNACMSIAEDLGADWIISIDTDELLEDRVSRRNLDRLMNHPDPLVDSYDFGWLNHWDSSRAIRIDMPWGDGGTFHGGMRGPRMWRVNKNSPGRIVAGNPLGLHCGNAPGSANFSRCVTGLRFRHYGYLRASDRHMKYMRYRQIDQNPQANLIGGATYGHIIDDEGMRLRPYVPNNGIGFHMLCYEKEPARMIASWLSGAYAICDRSVLVWTGEWDDADKKWIGKSAAEIAGMKKWPVTGPSQEVAEYAAWFDVEWVHSKFDDDLAACRNAGIEKLNEYANEGLGWAWFMDPDELANHIDLSYALRSMAEISDGWGWMFKFKNIHNAGQDSSFSERVSMSRLDPDGVMRMNGRVHESFSKAIRRINEMGLHPRLRYAPMTFFHAGLNNGPEAMKEKLAFYQRLLMKELEDDPMQPGPWVSLGLQFANDGDIKKAVQCYENGIACNDGSYLPYKELSAYHLRSAMDCIEKVLEHTVEGHVYHDFSKEILDFLNERISAQPLIGRTPDEDRTTPDVELPALRLVEQEDDSNGHAPSVVE